MSDWEVVSGSNSSSNDWETANGTTPVKPDATVVQKALGGARGLGLGAIQDVLAPIYMAGQEVAHGKNPTAWGGNQASSDELNQFSKSNPFASEDQLQHIGGTIHDSAVQGGKDIAGATSWMIPETKLLKGAGMVPKAVNLALQGGVQGGLQSASQEDATSESVLKSIGAGALVNPALGGAGNLLTRQLPKYFGVRAYGKAGAKLPEVLDAQREYGTEDLKAVKDYILESSKGTTTKNDLLQPVKDLAIQPEWVGTPGLSEMTRTGSARTGMSNIESGALKTIESQLGQSTDAFDFYSRLKNMAYSKNNLSSTDNRLANFMKSAAHKVREQIINSTENPDVTRKAMDAYAAQTAIKAAKNEKNTNAIVRTIERIIPFGEGGLGAISMIAAIPAFAHVAPILLADALLSNKVVAPKIASGLVNMGQKAEKTGLDSLLKRLGVGAATSMTNPQTTEQPL